MTYKAYNLNHQERCHLFLQMSCTKSGKWPLLYYSSVLCVLHFRVVFLLCRSSPLIFDVFRSVLDSNITGFVFSQSLYEFWTAVYYYRLNLFIVLEIRQLWSINKHDKLQKQSILRTTIQTTTLKNRNTVETVNW